jgi:thiamine-phosphate pyrophosphorylase
VKVDLTLYVLVDPALSGGMQLAAIAGAAARGGATLVQLRNKTGSTAEIVAQAKAIKQALVGTGVPLVINDHIDVAIAAEADGVHLGRDDLDPRAARQMLGPDAIIGATVRADIDVAALAPGIVDYVCIGGVFATASKDNPDPPIGLLGLSRLARLARERLPGIPVGAIAGINERNTGEVIEAGVDGIAVVSAITVALDPREAARGLRALVDAAKAKRGRAA